MATSEKRYPDEVMRPGILPGVLGAVAILLGVWLVGTEWEFAVRLAASILAAILVVFCLQARHRKFIANILLLAAIVVIWNPVIDLITPFKALGQGWLFIELLAAAIMLWSGFSVKVAARK
jgi:hypothetical protein